MQIIRKSNLNTDMDTPGGVLEVETPGIQDNRHTMVVRLSVLRTGRIYPREIFLEFIYVRS